MFTKIIIVCYSYAFVCYFYVSLYQPRSQGFLPPVQSLALQGRVGEDPGNEVVPMLLHVTRMYSPCTRMYPCGAWVEIATWPVLLWKVRTQESFRLNLIVRVNVVLNRAIVLVDTDWRFDNLWSSHLQNQRSVLISFVTPTFFKSIKVWSYLPQGATQSASSILNSAPVPHTHPKKFQFGIWDVPQYFMFVSDHLKNPAVRLYLGKISYSVLVTVNPLLSPPL